MALLGLLLLPSNFRAGGEISHGHSLLQLWADSTDGHVDHHHHHYQPADMSPSPLTDWLDPAAETPAPSVLDQDGIDVGSHDDSTPAPGTVLLLPATLAFFVAFAGVQLPTLQKEQTPVGCCPDVLLPPPR